VSKRTAIVLSGGKARRFQRPQQEWQDKALTVFKDKPLLLHVIENVTPVVDEIIICVNNEERRTKYSHLLEKKYTNTQIVVDEKTEINGPNTAILTGLKATKTNYCITIPCDMPFVKPQVTNYLFNLSEKENFDIVTPIWPNGILETLIMILQHSTGIEVIQTLCQLKHPRPSDIPRTATKTLLTSPLKTIKTLDPTLKSFININTPEDLKNLQTRSLQGPIQEDIVLNNSGFLVSDLQYMCDANRLCQEKRFMVAREKFEFCRSRFEGCDNYFWAALATEGVGEALFKQLQYQKASRCLPTSGLTLECRQAFLNAANYYNLETEFYEKRYCTRLLERATTDRDRVVRFAVDLLTNNVEL